MMSCLQLTQFKISYFILKEGWGECILAGGLRFCQAIDKRWALMISPRKISVHYGL